MSEEQRRRNPRYAFIASAELLEPQTDVRIATRVSELSLNGCYMDMLNPFPVGTPVLVKISDDAATFQSKARVIYAHPNFGAGRGIPRIQKPQYLTVLKGWISEAEKDPGRLLGIVPTCYSIRNSELGTKPRACCPCERLFLIFFLSGV